MKSKIAFSVFLLFVVLSLTRLLPKGSAESPRQDQDMATQVQRGVMTKTQRAHSKLYKRYESVQKIPDLVQREKDDVEVYRLLPLGADVSGGAAPSTSDILRHAVCNANAVVRGVVKDMSSQLTEGESFVFTDYEITVKEVLKNNEASPIGNGITVTRPGGIILLNGKRVRAIDESFQPLKVDREYILFLRFLPETGTYESIESGESFEIIKDKVKSLKEESLDRFATEYTSTSLVNEIRNATAAPCNGNKRGAQ